jgi:hypothetical protein
MPEKDGSIPNLPKQQKVHTGNDTDSQLELVALKAQIPLGSHLAQSTVCLDTSVNAIQIRTKESDCWKTRTPKHTDSCDVRESPGLIWKNGTQKEVFGEKRDQRRTREADGVFKREGLLNICSGKSQ